MVHTAHDEMPPTTTTKTCQSLIQRCAAQYSQEKGTANDKAQRAHPFTPSAAATAAAPAPGSAVAIWLLHEDVLDRDATVLLLVVFEVHDDHLNRSGSIQARAGRGG